MAEHSTDNRKAEGSIPSAPTTAAEAPISDAERYRALREYLKLVRAEAGSYTCWLELACIPFRSASDDPQVLVDKLVRILRERGL